MPDQTTLLLWVLLPFVTVTATTVHSSAGVIVEDSVQIVTQDAVVLLNYTITLRTNDSISGDILKDKFKDTVNHIVSTLNETLFNISVFLNTSPPDSETVYKSSIHDNEESTVRSLDIQSETFYLTPTFIYSSGPITYQITDVFVSSSVVTMSTEDSEEESHTIGYKTNKFTISFSKSIHSDELDLTNSTILSPRLTGVSTQDSMLFSLMPFTDSYATITDTLESTFHYVTMGTTYGYENNSLQLITAPVNHITISLTAPVAISSIKTFVVPESYTLASSSIYTGGTLNPILKTITDGSIELTVVPSPSNIYTHSLTSWHPLSLYTHTISQYNTLSTIEYNETLSSFITHIATHGQSLESTSAKTTPKLPSETLSSQLRENTYIISDTSTSDITTERRTFGSISTAYTTTYSPLIDFTSTGDASYGSPPVTITSTKDITNGSLSITITSREDTTNIIPSITITSTEDTTTHGRPSITIISTEDTTHGNPSITITSTEDTAHGSPSITITSKEDAIIHGNPPITITSTADSTEERQTIVSGSTTSVEEITAGSQTTDIINTPYTTLGNPIIDTTSTTDTTPGNPSIDITRTIDNTPGNPTVDIISITDTPPEHPTIDITSIEAFTHGSPTIDITSIEATTLGSPTIDMTSIEATTHGSPTIDITSIEATTLGSPTIDITSIEAITHGSPTIDITSIEAFTHGSPTIDITSIEATTLGSPTIDITSIEAFTHGSPTIDITSIEAITHGSPTIDITSIEAFTHGSPTIDITSIEATTLGSPTIDITSIEAIIHGSPSKDITSSTDSIQENLTTTTDSTISTEDPTPETPEKSSNSLSMDQITSYTLPPTTITLPAETTSSSPTHTTPETLEASTPVLTTTWSRSTLYTPTATTMTYPAKTTTSNPTNTIIETPTPVRSTKLDNTENTTPLTTMPFITKTTTLSPTNTITETPTASFSQPWDNSTTHTQAPTVKTTLTPDISAIVAELKGMVTNTSDPKSLTASNVMEYADRVLKLYNESLHNNEVARNAFLVIGNLGDVNVSISKQVEEEGQINSKLRGFLDNYTAEINLEVNNGTVNIPTPQLHLRAISLRNLYNASSTTFPFDVEITDDNVTAIMTMNVTVTLPLDLLRNIYNESIDNRIQFVAYKRSQLFVPAGGFPQDGSVLDNQRVVSISIKGHHSVNLTENIVIILPAIRDIAVNTSIFQLIVDFLARLSQERTMTACTGILQNSQSSPLSQEHEVILTYLTYIGCGISTTGLLVTLVTFSMFRCLNSEKPGKILMNLCTALLLLNVAFLAATVNVSGYSDGWCLTAGMFLHYLVLTSLMWMLVEALDIYKALIIVFIVYERFYLIKRCLIAWGVPVVVVAVTAALDSGAYGMDKTSRKFCFMTSDSTVPFYASLVAPSCVIIIINIFVFIRVVRVVLKPNIHKQLMSDTRTVTLSQIRGAVTVMFLLGVTWVFGPLAIGNAKTTFNYLFCICNSFQGCVIFVCRCLCNKEARLSWMQFFRTGTCKSRRGPYNSAVSDFTGRGDDRRFSNSNTSGSATESSSRTTSTSTASSRHDSVGHSQHFFTTTDCYCTNNRQRGGRNNETIQDSTWSKSTQTESGIDRLDKLE